MRFAVVAATLAVFACDSSVKVGDVRPDEAPPPSSGLPIDGGDDAAVARLAEWRRHAPLIPCSMYALTETRSDNLYIGCNGGLVYQFDGVDAHVAFQADDASIVGLLWAAASGEVWAGAQANYDPNATTQLYHGDGTTWSKVGNGSERITSLTGIGSDVWITTDQEIRHYENGAFAKSFATTKGAFRACAFPVPEQGYCVGTEGLAVVWDGKGWSPLANVPWSSSAIVFGVELDPWAKTSTFLYGEPLDDIHGDHTCKMARLSDGTFAASTASTPCFLSDAIARKRTGQASIGAHSFVLVAPEDDYGGTLVFDPGADSVQNLCGPALAFSRGLSNTRAGGLYGFLGTITGTGDNLLAFASQGSSNLDFRDLAVAPDGSAWARISDQTVCGSGSFQLVRFENGAWGPVAAPDGALSGESLSAVSRDIAYTIDLPTNKLLTFDSGHWVEGLELGDSPWSLFASKTDDVWVGGGRGSLGHFDGKTFTTLEAGGGSRQVEQLLAVGDDLWMVQRGFTADDTDFHLVRSSNGALSELDVGLDTVRLSALDDNHIYACGLRARVWNGAKWTALSFGASGVWARSPEEVYFSDRGDIWRWDGHERTRVYHGVMPITAMVGSKDRAFAVGPGGLTIEFAEWPNEQR
jgi:hypothetical protein